MTLRIKAILTFALISLIFTGILVGFMFYLTKTSLSYWENRDIEKGLVIGVNNAKSPVEQAQAEKALRTYRQLKGLKGLFEWQIIGFALLLGVFLFIISVIISSIALFRITRPLNELTTALARAGEGDLDIRIAAPKSEIGQVINAYNKMTVQLKKSQEELKRAVRIAAWRDVARVLAHEVRNPLTPIRLAIERLVEKHRNRAGDFPQVLEKSANIILSEITALERIVREFSNFARLPAPVLKPVNINHLIEEVVTGYEGYDKRIRIYRDFDDSIGDLLLDGELFKQVISNLIKNSFDALKREDGEIRLKTLKSEDMVRLEFIDNGDGIQPDLIDKVFEPYFTTKARGTGLGLAVVKHIVNEHGGDVALESQVGRGTRVIVNLPYKTLKA